MPPKTRIHHPKLSRKQLRQPDEFQTFFENARDALLANLRAVMISAAAVVAVALIALGAYAYLRHRSTLVAGQFYTALGALKDKNYKSAADDFTRLADNEPRRELGRLARFYAGICYLDQNQLDKAREALTAYLATARDPAFISLAWSDLALAYERRGDFEQAQAAYAQAAGIDGPGQARAELEVAQMMLKQGDRKGAIKAYQRFLLAHPFTRERQTVVETLASLGAPPAAVNPSVKSGPAAPRPSVR